MVTTLAPNDFFKKCLSSLFIAFSSYDFNRHENLGKAVSLVVTNGISPRFPRATFRSGITEPLIISLYIEADFNKRASWVLPGAPTTAYNKCLL